MLCLFSCLVYSNKVKEVYRMKGEQKKRRRESEINFILFLVALYWWPPRNAKTKWRTLPALTLYSLTVLSSIICLPPKIRRCCGGGIPTNDNSRKFRLNDGFYLLSLRHVLWYVRFYRYHRCLLRFLCRWAFLLWSSSLQIVAWQRRAIWFQNFSARWINMSLFLYIGWRTIFHGLTMKRTDLFRRKFLRSFYSDFHRRFIFFR